MLLGEGRRVLIFSQFTSMLALIEAQLTQAGIPYVLLTGDTADRSTPVRRFQAGEVPVFLISLKAGGIGLNLTAADTVIHYDPWWNPAVEDQATDRAHRIGQDKPVFVHRLVALGTIEEKMEALKERKRALVASVLDAEHGGALQLTEADVEAAVRRRLTRRGGHRCQRHRFRSAWRSNWGAGRRIRSPRPAPWARRNRPRRGWR